MTTPQGQVPEALGAIQKPVPASLLNIILNNEARATPEEVRRMAAELVAARTAQVAALTAAPGVQAEVENLRKALQFYADKEHFNIADDGAWDTVSGEPQNYWCDEEGTATVEDGTIARLALAGHPIKFEADATPAQPAPGVESNTAGAAPIDMVLHCPACGQQHIDAADPPITVLEATLRANPLAMPAKPRWSNPPHRSHLCHGCGHIWRPADVPTNGVAAVKTTGKADSPIASHGQAPAGAAPVTLWGHAFEYVDKGLLQHADDVAVDRFAVAMKEKLAAARAKGRGGWDSNECTQQRLSDMLRDHVDKGDPRDVANFCLFLWCRGEAINKPTTTAQAAPAAGAVAGPSDAVAYLDIGSGGYRDIGTNLTDEALSRLPKGRHVLVIAGTYGVDGYVAAAPTPAAQADSQTAPQGETNVQLDTDSNPSTPGQQRDMACSLALGQSMGHGHDQASGHPSAQGDKLLTVAERNIRSFLRSAVFKIESDREAALSCVDVLRDAARAQADSVLEDAARWNEVLMHVGAANHLGGQHFTLNTLRIRDQMFLLRGSVAQHFTACIDDSRAAHKQGGAT